MANPSENKPLKAIPILLERRKFIRHPLTMPLKYQVLKTSSGLRQKEKPSETIDISQGGLMFSARRPVKIDSKIIVKMPFEDKVFNVPARVAHCNRNPETRLYEIGVCFYRLKEAFKVKLIEQIYLISEYRDLRSLELGKAISLEEASCEWIKRYSRRFKRLYGW
ncbi:MAG: PilZ domain-containing protein [Candidatus Omnitrophota bacterium]